MTYRTPSYPPNVPLRVSKYPAASRPGERYDGEVARASLRLSLLEAALWSNARARVEDPTGSLRTAALAPYIFNEHRHATVGDVVSARHRALVDAKQLLDLRGGQWDGVVDVGAIGIHDVRSLLGAGRLLAWERDSTIDDGVGQFETKGFLDDSDMPPWDTWIAYVDCAADPDGHNYLVSWVPAPFIEVVGNAIRCNAYEALYWLADSKRLLAQILAEDDLLR